MGFCHEYHHTRDCDIRDFCLGSQVSITIHRGPEVFFIQPFPPSNTKSFSSGWFGHSLQSEYCLNRTKWLRRYLRFIGLSLPVCNVLTRMLLQRKRDDEPAEVATASATRATRRSTRNTVKSNEDPVVETSNSSATTRANKGNMSVSKLLSLKFVPHSIVLAQGRRKRHPRMRVYVTPSPYPLHRRDVSYSHLGRGGTREKENEDRDEE